MIEERPQYFSNVH